MAKLTKRLTDGVARAVPLPAAPGGVDFRTIKGKRIELSKAIYVFHWCRDTAGFGLRVSSTGDKAYVSERRVEGKTVRRTLGKAVGSEAISADSARKLMIEVSGELQSGVDRMEVKREARKVAKQDATNLVDALKAYVKGKRRGKDGLPLKDRTKADYLSMVQPGAIRKSGEQFANGPLYHLAEKSIFKITAADMRKAYEATAKKSQRTAVYAMQVLRAVLNWHGVQIEGSPLAKATAGRDRIILPSTIGNPKPIPPEKLGAWWRAAMDMVGSDAADGCRFILLTGCRPGEVFGGKGDGWNEPGLLVENVDLRGARITLLDTKNRKDHIVTLSKQALAIVKLHCKGKRPSAKVFDILDPGKTLEAINSTAEVVGITPHKLRHTFASVAEDLVSAYALKRMMNHADGADVTGAHYVGKSEAQLRAAWQTVANFIESAA